MDKLCFPADPRIALAANVDSANGSQSGNTPTSSGNVNAVDLWGLVSGQYWEIESGGEQITRSDVNITKVSSEDILYGVTETYSLAYPVQNYGDTLLWSTANSSVASVSMSGGDVTFNNLGKAQINVSVYSQIGLNTGVYSTIFYVILEDGTYYFTSAYNTSYQIGVKDSNIEYDTPILAVSASGTPTDRGKMFKIKYLGSGKYSMRSMLSNDAGPTNSNSVLTNSEIGVTDSIPYSAFWFINTSSLGTYIHPAYETTKAIYMGGSTTGGRSLTVDTFDQSNPRFYWTIAPIEAEYHGIFIRDSVNNLMAGDRFDFSASVYSTYTNANGQSDLLWSVDNVTGQAIIDTYSGVLKGIHPGTVVVTLAYKPNTCDVFTSTYTVNIYPNVEAIHFTNIEYIRYTRVQSYNTTHILTVLKSSLLNNDIFIAENETNHVTRSYEISLELINTLNGLEEAYHNHTIPSLHASTQETAAHNSKTICDELVLDGYFAQGCSEYYGVWANNYEYLLEFVECFEQALDITTKAYSIYIATLTYYCTYLTNNTYYYVPSNNHIKVSSTLDDIDDALSTISHSNKTILTSDSRNATLAEQGYTNPLPYEPNTPVVKYKQTTSTQYVRVYNGQTGNSRGRWIMKQSDIEGLTPTQIQSKYALPDLPTEYCYVYVPEGTDIYIGLVNQSSVEGALQYETSVLLPESSFGLGIPLS